MAGHFFARSASLPVQVPLLVFLLALGGWLPAQAALDIGEVAPKFTATAALGGKTFRYSLAEALAKFSVKSCQSRFSVASDESKTVIRGFDALMQTRPDLANRLSYVISQDGKVAYCCQNLNPDRHVQRMLAAVKALPKATAR